jgi:hypothetical protein
MFCAAAAIAKTSTRADAAFNRNNRFIFCNQDAPAL